MRKCNVCGAELPDGVQECPSCKVWQEPPAKFVPGQVVKCETNGKIIYNYVVDSYYNRNVNMRLYRLNERFAMPVWREDWLQPVSQEEIDRVNKSGELRPRQYGGWEIAK